MGGLMKAILGVVVAAGALDRAVSEGEAVCDCAARSKTVKTTTPTSALTATTAV
jgi:hypothetical protein